MTDGNGAAPPEPVPVLAGHLMIYDDVAPSGCLLSFRPDGGADETQVYRPLIPVAREQLVELLTPGEGGILAAVMNGQIPKVNRETRRAMMAAARGQGASGGS